MQRLFNEHPASVGESYTEHMGTAWSFSARMLIAGLACFVHGIFPFLFVKTGSQAITELHDRMVTHRRRAELAAGVPSVPRVPQAAE